MNNKPQDCMTIGLIHHAAFPEAANGKGAIVQTLKAICKDDYFQAVEVAPIADPDVRRGAVEIAKSSGKAVIFDVVPALLSRALDLNSLDPAIRQKAVDEAREYLAEAIEWGACAMTVVSGPDIGEEKRLAAKALLQASLKELCEISRRLRGPSVFLENFDRTPEGMNRLLGPTIEAASLVLKVHGFYLSVGLVINLSRMAMLGAAPDKVLKLASPVVRSVRIPACGGKVDEMAAHLKLLLEMGYVGEGKANGVSLDVTPCEGTTSEQAIARAKETFDAAWAAL